MTPNGSLEITAEFFVAIALNLIRSADSNASGRLSTKQQDKNQQKITPHGLLRSRRILRNYGHIQHFVIDCC
jgi:hypothetical protein